MITVNQQTCTQCGLCAAVCATNIIDFKPGQYPSLMPGYESQCLKCGHCVGICPSGSLTHPHVPLADCPPLKNELRLTPEQCEQFIRSRRSIREYKNQPVPREVISRLINLARYAPSGHNDQDVDWLVIDNKEDLLKIEKAGTEWVRDAIKTQPRFSQVMDFPRMLQKQEKNYNQFLRGAPVLIIAMGSQKRPMSATNCVIAMTTLELAATSLGLGGCWAGFVSIMANSFAPMQEALGIPADKAGYAHMMLGYPQYRYQRLVARKSPRITWK
jgi:nitroreductase/NAD-dependent dihydropyrimidine dehydrogenase PreA subunit